MNRLIISRIFYLQYFCILLIGSYLPAQISLPLPVDIPVYHRPVPIFFGNIYWSKFIKHSPRLTGPTGQTVPAAEIGFQFETFGNRDWQAAHHCPAYGVSLIWIQPGSDAHGSLIGLFPHLTLPAVKFRGGGVYFRVGSGVGWATRPYDAFSNPSQNALGSNWNNITQFRCSAKWGRRHWTGEAGAMLTHFSNGGLVLPNFGMNMPGFFAGMTYAPADLRQFHTRQQVSKKPGRRWGFNFQSGFSGIEYIAIDGPKYAVWMLSGAFTMKLHKYNRLAVGFDWEKNKAVEAWLLNNTLLPGGEAGAAKGAQRTGLFLADEFFFGNVSIYLQASYHIGKAPLNSQAISNNYNKLGVRYYLPALPGLPVRLYSGVSLKAYKAVAELIAVHAGVDF